MAKNEHCSCAAGHLKKAMAAADSDDHRTAMHHVGHGMLALKRARGSMAVAEGSDVGPIGGVRQSDPETGNGASRARLRAKLSGMKRV